MIYAWTWFHSHLEFPTTLSNIYLFLVWFLFISTKNHLNIFFDLCVNRTSSFIILLQFKRKPNKIHHLGGFSMRQRFNWRMTIYQCVFIVKWNSWASFCLFVFFCRSKWAHFVCERWRDYPRRRTKHQPTESLNHLKTRKLMKHVPCASNVGSHSTAFTLTLCTTPWWWAAWHTIMITFKHKIILFGGLRHRIYIFHFRYIHKMVVLILVFIAQMIDWLASFSLNFIMAFAAKRNQKICWGFTMWIRLKWKSHFIFNLMACLLCGCCLLLCCFFFRRSPSMSCLCMCVWLFGGTDQTTKMCKVFVHNFIGYQFFSPFLVGLIFHQCDHFQDTLNFNSNNFRPI